MNDVWFDPNRWAWLPGTLLGSLGGLWGALLGSLAPRGKARGLVLCSGFLLLGTGVALLIAAIAALVDGQPYGIWYGLGLPGILLTVLMTMFLPMAFLRYRQAEERRMSAKDLR